MKSPPWSSLSAACSVRSKVRADLVSAAAGGCVTIPYEYCRESSTGHRSAAAALCLNPFHFVAVRAPALSPFRACHAHAIAGEASSHDFDLFADHLRGVLPFHRSWLRRDFGDGGVQRRFAGK